MKRGIPFIFLLAFIGCQTAPQFKPLFKSDLTGWYAKDGHIESWQFADGMLSCVAPGGGWLTTEKEYANFILRLDWRVPESGNSGVGIRFPKEGNPAHDGMEIQILDDNAEIHKNIEDVQYTGSIYYQVAAKKGLTKPVGEWNHYEITCDGPLVTVKLNGEIASQANLDEYTTAHGDYLPLSQRPRQGHIGVQSHGTRVDFKNLEIVELP